MTMRRRHLAPTRRTYDEAEPPAVAGGDTGDQGGLMAGRTVVADALERAHALLATHEVPPLPDDVQRELVSIATAFRRVAS